MLSPEDLAKLDKRPHGIRARYTVGCRCVECRRANSRYETERAKARKAGDWNGLVDADRARSHLERLSRKGVGRRAVAAATDCSETVLAQIRSGQKRRIRARTERKILRCTPAIASDHALTDAGPTWRRVEWLLEEGFTKAEISRRIGQGGRALQLGRRTVTVRNAAKIERLYRTFTK